jgi:RNA polymerase sigma-70 factor (ECF subfamily)
MYVALPWRPPHALSGLPVGPGVAYMVGDPLAEVAREAQQGSAAARRRLFETLAPALLAPLRIVLGATHPDLEDVLQDSLLGVLRGLPTFRGESTVLHFARRIATKRAIELRRREGANARKLASVSTLDPPASPNPGETVEADRRRVHLRMLLATLPEVQADALAMRSVLGYSVEEIAEEMRVPPNTVRSRLRLAKEALRERIDGDPALRELVPEDT